MPYDRYVFNNCKFYYHALTIRYTSSQIFVHGNLLNFSSNKLSICIFISGKTMNPIHSQMTTLSETYISRQIRNSLENIPILLKVPQLI